jgi:hypothetical protein
MARILVVTFHWQSFTVPEIPKRFVDVTKRVVSSKRPPPAPENEQSFGALSEAAFSARACTHNEVWRAFTACMSQLRPWHCLRIRHLLLSRQRPPLVLIECLLCCDWAQLILIALQEKDCLQ